MKVLCIHSKWEYESWGYRFWERLAGRRKKDPVYGGIYEILQETSTHYEFYEFMGEMYTKDGFVPLTESDEIAQSSKYKMPEERYYGDWPYTEN